MPASTTSPLATATRKLSLKPSDNPQWPTVDQCIAHLRLLSCFHKLRQDIENAEDLWGISDRFKDHVADLSEDQWEKAHDALKKKRWEVYVARAAYRFEKWWQATPSTRNGERTERLKIADMDAKSDYEKRSTSGKKIGIDVRSVPPLDVLMVWHSHMLNPRCHLEDCMRSGKIDLWYTGMPWATVDQCIDSSDFTYHATGEAVQFFEKSTGLAWSNLSDSMQTSLDCLGCSKVHDVPWTTCTTEKYAPQAREVDVVTFLTERGEGRADNGFAISCSSCATVTNQGHLQVRKFIYAMRALRNEGEPMPGTAFSLSGRPEGPTSRLGMSRHPENFPNRILGSGELHDDIMAAVKSGGGSPPTLAQMRQICTEHTQNNKKLLRAAYNSTMNPWPRLGDSELKAIRRMFSRFENNPWESFALDLASAVIRQGEFVIKMSLFDWIHSPAVASTMDNLLTRYERFFTLMRRQPSQVMVPTLDIDLAWHTHQLNPPRYYEYSVSHTAGVFIDHDDKISTNVLDDSFERSTELYESLFGEPYSYCLCWECEELRAEGVCPCRDCCKERAGQKEQKRLREERLEQDRSVKAVNEHGTKDGGAITVKVNSCTYPDPHTAAVGALRAAESHRKV